MQKSLNLTEHQKHIIFLVIILLFSFTTKTWRLGFPKDYYFDEIYYGFTAEQYAKGNINAWVYDAKPPEGFSYTWDHPPTGKLLMSLPIMLMGESGLARRMMPLIFGTLLTLLTYYFSLTLFPKKKSVAILSALLVSIDGLVLAMSRIALVDVILASFILLSVVSLWQKKVIYSAIFFGLAVSTKWTGVFLIPIFGLYQLLEFKLERKDLFKRLKKVFLESITFLCIGVAVYIISYTPLLIHFSWEKFISLQKQMYWFHTGLKSTHPNQSLPHTWPLNIEPVWFWVEYGLVEVSNIYAMGNPVLFWGGLLCVLFTSISVFKTKSKKGLYLLACYFVFWLPWIFSKRVMFLYHYLPSVPFLVVCTALVLDKLAKFFGQKGRLLVLIYVFLVFYVFVYFYPHWTGIPVDPDMANSYFWLESWR